MSPTGRRAAAGIGMAVAAMVSVQSGLALSLRVAASTGPEAVAWFRLLVAGVVLLVACRPWTARWTRSSVVTCAVLGAVTGAMTLLFMLAATRLPLGTASALEFTGPLAVALWRGSGWGRVWALPATVGLVVLTRPWAGASDPTGVVLALCSGACWAAYIVLTDRVASALAGATPLGVSMPVAALAVTPIVVGGSAPIVDVPVLPLLVLAAVLVPLLPFVLELLALRRLPAATFSATMSVEPAIAAVIGALVLRQRLDGLEVAGIALVVLSTLITERVNRPRGGALDLERA